jgi:hypothetical protein
MARHVRVPRVFLGTINVAPGGTTLDYQYGGFKVVGRVFGPGGKLIRDGTVQAYGSEHETRRGVSVEGRIRYGRYTMFLARGSYYFRTKPSPTYFPGVADHREISISRDTTLNFSEDGNLIRGKITIGRRPLASVEIEADGGTLPDKFEVTAQNTPKRDGSYRFYLPRGHYIFIAKPGGSSAHVSRRIFHHEVTGPQTLNLDLSGVEWQGTVRDSITGAGAKSVTVSAALGGSGIPAVSTTDRRGRFNLVLERGRSYVISLSRDDGTIAPKEIRSLFAGGDSTFDLLVRTERR